DPCGANGGGHRGYGPDSHTPALLVGSLHPTGTGRHPLRAAARGAHRGARAGDLRPRGRGRRARLQRFHGRPRPRLRAHGGVPDLLPSGRGSGGPRRPGRREILPPPGAVDGLPLRMRGSRHHLRVRDRVASCGVRALPYGGGSDGRPSVRDLRSDKSGASRARRGRSGTRHRPFAHL
ncbi:Substrate-specific component BioY of biotin ECF transporter, partial [uncultured Rubrobacteraceae bacterium]